MFKEPGQKNIRQIHVHQKWIHPVRANRNHPKQNQVACRLHHCHSPFSVSPTSSLRKRASLRRSLRSSSLLHPSVVRLKTCPRSVSMCSTIKPLAQVNETKTNNTRTRALHRRFHEKNQHADGRRRPVKRNVERQVDCHQAFSLFFTRVDNLLPTSNVS